MLRPFLESSFRGVTGLVLQPSGTEKHTNHTLVHAAPRAAGASHALLHAHRVKTTRTSPRARKHAQRHFRAVSCTSALCWHPMAAPSRPHQPPASRTTRASCACIILGISILPHKKTNPGKQKLRRLLEQHPEAPITRGQVCASTPPKKKGESARHFLSLIFCRNSFGKRLMPATRGQVCVAPSTPK